MKSVFQKMSLAGVVALLLTGTQAKADLLSDLVAGGSIQVEDKLFDNWQILSNLVVGDTSGRTQVNLANIDVVGVPGNPLNPGLRFFDLNNELSITQLGIGTALLDLDFRFDVTVLDPDLQWTDNQLTAWFGGSSPDPMNNNHSAHVHEFLFDTGSLIPFATKDRHFINDDGVPEFDDQSGIPDTAVFTGRTTGTVLKDITLETHIAGETTFLAPNGPAGEVFNQFFSQTETQMTGIPEPASLLVWGALLAAGCVATWRRRRWPRDRGRT